MTNYATWFGRYMWIVDWLKTNNPYGRCAQATLEMQEAFPDLKRVRGHYYDAAWGQREHWWLQDADGTVVDPTMGQFPSKGQGLYIPLDESLPEPIGKCMNCGEYCYENANFCCKECEIRVMADFR